MRGMPSPAELLAEAERLRQSGDGRRALELCTQLLQANPSYPPALHLMAQIAAGLGQFQAAIHYADLARTAAPDSGEYQLTLGTLLLSAGQASRAGVVLDAAVQRMPQSFDAWANLGTALATTGRTAEAAVAMERAIALEPRREEAYANRAQ